ncbi:hypothetical protein [Variovorax boronicumulans]|uniref:hypothetical protein n=1 Tax=Variovorax boronicumulans TaxID=436515 RepID=UPI001C563EA3
MSGISTGNTVALVQAGRGLDIETYSSPLDCVLKLVNNGRLGTGVDPKAIGWGSDAHKQAVTMVEAQIAKVRAGFAEQDRAEAEFQRAARGGA